MKRLLALLLSGIMVLSMAACGNTSSVSGIRTGSTGGIQGIS